MLQFDRGRNKHEAIPLPSIPSNAEMPASALDRVVVVGISGAGKSTFARTLAAHLASRHVELDAINWLPGWVAEDQDRFRAAVREAVAGRRWVVDGNYTRTRDLIWPRATTIFWLDYSFPLVFWRALRRTTMRIVNRETILNGNRETLRGALFSFDGVPAWVLRRYRIVRREYSTLFAGGRHEQARVIVFRHPKEAQRFLAATFPASDD